MRFYSLVNLREGAICVLKQYRIPGSYLNDVAAEIITVAKEKYPNAVEILLDLDARLMISEEVTENDGMVGGHDGKRMDRIKELAAENKRLAALNDMFPQEIARLEDRVSAEYEAERADDRARMKKELYDAITNGRVTKSTYDGTVAERLENDNKSD